MKWSWQRSDWPKFSWSPGRLARAEEQFLLGGGVILGTVEHLDDEDKHRLVVESMSEEAATTSEIEGELLDRDSVQSSIRRQLGLAADARRVSPAEQGIAELMVDLYQHSEAPLDAATLCSWHEMLMRGRRDLTNLGSYRTHAEPMQVVSGSYEHTKVHFEAPPSSRVPAEMRKFLEWFARTAPTGSDPLPAMTRAATAHLYFECIHPFEDGNGRIGRAISEKALSQGLGRPTLTALAATILLQRRSYYEALEDSNKSNEITGWLTWFAGITLEAQLRTQVHIEFLLEKARLMDRLRGNLNARQEKAMLRMLREGPGGFQGGLSAGNYVSITKTSPATARRDLGDLVDNGALKRTGERRHARYHFPFSVRQVPRITVDEVGRIVHAVVPATRKSAR